MTNLLRKEFALAMHPITPLMLALSAMVLIPNYPYIVIFFYTAMSIFFTCLMGRENNDIVYSINLPVSKESIVRARFAFAIILEMFQMTIMIPFTVFSHRLNPLGNQAGMDANLALYGLAFIVYGIFNLVFFYSYYKDVAKVGIAFLKSSAVLLVLACLDPVSTYAIPFVKDVLDTPGTENFMVKIIFLVAGVAIFVVLTGATYKISVRNFEEQDLN
ncbi:MAG: hypothetical protein GX852_07125 [Clostridiales bacterium]|nr:hypothetical protein [Clostridiales bacterium]